MRPRHLKQLLARFLSKAAHVLDEHPPHLPKGAQFVFRVAAELEIETYFETPCGSRSGEPIEVFKHYRYSVKPGWLFYDPLFGLNQLKRLSLLTPAQIEFMHRAGGDRTLTLSLEEIDAFARPLLDQHADRFVPGTVMRGKRPFPALTAAEVGHSVEQSRRQFTAMFKDLTALGIGPRTPPGRVLEIGFTTGISPMALQALGCEAFALDTHYGDGAGKSTVADHYRSLVSSDVRFVHGDITQRTRWDDGHFDIVYSASVLEHLQDIPSAFSEMYRLLRPGGLMIHQYNPYFCPNGGHALGIADRPWGHVLMDEPTYSRYLDTMRPHEADHARAWIRDSLNRDYPLGRMQAAIARAGFEFELWRESPAPQGQCQFLSGNVIARARAVNPGLTVADLVTNDVFFVARKPA